MALYPWQQQAWQQLNQQRRQWPHALLLSGPQGIGKLDFARLLAQSLLCEAPQADHQPCGQCPACNWFGAGSHPDFRELAPASADEDDNKDGDAGKKKRAVQQINIKKVRELNDFVNLSSHRQGYRVTLLHPAEALNHAAANALLKTLEEPAPGAVFIVISHRLSRVLPTIRSRCRLYPLPTPNAGQSQAWLAQQAVADAGKLLARAGQLPLAAKALADSDNLPAWQSLLETLAAARGFDSLKTAESLQKLELPQVIGWLQKWVYDLLSCKLSGQVRYHPDLLDALRQHAARLPLQGLLDYQKQLQTAQRSAHHPLNVRLAIEALLLGYTQL
jgi:DNA polymerase-3 subunit delta'